MHCAAGREGGQQAGGENRKIEQQERYKMGMGEQLVEKGEKAGGRSSRRVL